MATHRPDEIVIKAMCLIKHDGKLLVSEGYDKVKEQKHYRLLGGTVDFGETSEEGMRREIKEELKCIAENMRLVTVVENIYTFEGKTGHQIVFLYECELSDKSLYGQPAIHIIEDAYELDAKWISIEEIMKGSIPLYPSFNYSKILS
jgi:ADP-ribose pyrophosphatase YjhB (NUDIX family)